MTQLWLLFLVVMILQSTVAQETAPEGFEQWSAESFKEIHGPFSAAVRWRTTGLVLARAGRLSDVRG
jgi:hypothetical protein